MTTPHEAECFLRGFHARRPGVTREAFARGRALGDGRSSYELLADRLGDPRGRAILDVGCGDGWLAECLLARGVAASRLIGVDISAAELRVARQRVPDAAWLHARAEALPLATASVGACASHLAFSLLVDPVPSVREIARVLVPGGTFAIVTGGGPADDDAFAWFLELLQPVLAAGAVPRLGDRRTRHATGLDELLGPHGFTPVSWTRHVIDLGGAWPDVWRTLSTIYELAGVAEDTVLDLASALASRTRGLARVPCTMAIGVASTTRRSS